MTTGKRCYLPLTLLSALLSMQAHAQDVKVKENPATDLPSDSANEDETIVLSPFVIDTTKDTGYAANDTLSGTRLKTDLGDIATSIQVVTKEMLQDTGSTNAREILVYTTNTEVGGIGGNFSA